MNGYNLIRDWYNFKFTNPSKAKAIHSDMYCYLVDLWNRLGQKSEFGLPTTVTMEVLGIGSYNTYKKTLNDLIQFGFIKVISESKNQHQSKIIALSKNDKATDKALDEATIKATDKATDTINKQKNNRTIDEKNKFKEPSFDEVNDYCIERNNDIDVNKFINFYQSKGWMVGKNKMKDWKAAVRNWEKPKNKESEIAPELQHLLNHVAKYGNQ